MFDQLIYNTDRNGNLLVDARWHLWTIDHTRSFKIFGELKNPQALGARCEQDLLAGLRRLDRATLQAAMQELLGPGQIEGLLARRDRIVQFYDAQVAARGPQSVFYRLPPRGGRPPLPASQRFGTYGTNSNAPMSQTAAPTPSPSTGLPTPR